jgi:hypothetical protein
MLAQANNTITPATIFKVTVSSTATGRKYKR